MQKQRRIIIIPKSVSKEPRFALAVQIESRNGLMVKTVPGMLLFTAEEIEKARQTCTSIGSVVDLRLK